MARLDRFAPVREVAQIGAAIGREFSWELLAAVWPHAEAGLDQALAQLVQSGLAFRQGTPPDAVYTFKHALVQDTAYDSLLKRRRQELHEKIARAIEQRFPKVADTEPELLAHHYTEAKQPEKAIPLWQKAGGFALKRLALKEALANLNKGLDLVAMLPPSPERDGKEVDLRSLLGTAWTAFRGWAAPEVLNSLHPALELAASLGRNDALRAILYGLWGNVLCGGRAAESLGWAAKIMDAAAEYRDSDLLMIGHYCAINSYFWHGRLIKAQEHVDELLALYDRERHRHLLEILHLDLKTAALKYSAEVAWMHGYPEQAVRMIKAADTNARQIGHPFDLGWALTTGAAVFDFLGQADEILKRAAEAERLGREYGLSYLTAHLAPSTFGIGWIRKGQFAEGIAALQAAIAFWIAAGAGIAVPFLRSIQAEGTALLGDLDGALDLIEEVITQVERPGWEERSHYAEILRIKGWLLALRRDQDGAERSYLASLDWARQQRAKSWELRTATSYARLMRDQGRAPEAHDLLAPIYGWFTEGSGTKDLKEAKVLLRELKQPIIDDHADTSEAKR